MVEYRAIKKLKIAYAVIVISLYFVSFILVNIGFYTPEWYTFYIETPDGPIHYYTRIRICNEVGLVSGDCRYPYTGMDKGRGDIGLAIRSTFYMMMTAICLLYTTLVVLVAVVIFNCLENPIFMSFGSIVVGVLYPAAAILTIFASIYAELSNTSAIGYSAIITNVGGGIMLICYVMLGMYKKVFGAVKKF